MKVGSWIAIVCFSMWVMPSVYAYFDPTARPQSLNLLQFKKSGSSPKKDSQYNLQSLSQPDFVFSDASKAFMMIKGKSFYVGDYVGKHQLVKISKNELSFKSGQVLKKIPYMPQIVRGIQK